MRRRMSGAVVAGAVLLAIGGLIALFALSEGGGYPAWHRGIAWMLLAMVLFEIAVLGGVYLGVRLTLSRHSSPYPHR